MEGGSYTPHSTKKFNGKSRIYKGVYITGKSWTTDGMLLSPEEILMHELVGHGIPDIAGPESGNAIINDNKARIEAGLNPRPDDPKHLE